MASWPAGLQQKNFAGVIEQRQQAFLRSSMDSGAPKKRKMFTAATRDIPIPMVFTTAERAIFDTFYITTLGEGTLPFDWTDPVDDTTVISFSFKSPPRMTKVAGEWKTILNLEVLP